MILGTFNRRLVEGDISYWCVSDENIYQLLQRNSKRLLIALLINRQYSKKTFSGSFEIIKLKNRGEVWIFPVFKVNILNALFLKNSWTFDYIDKLTSVTILQMSIWYSIINSFACIVDRHILPLCGIALALFSFIATALTLISLVEVLVIFYIQILYWICCKQLFTIEMTFKFIFQFFAHRFAHD